MKLLIVLVCLAFVCMIQSAPKTTPRHIIIQDYHSDDEVVVNDDEAIVPDDESKIDSTTTTTTPIPTRRSTYVFPTRNYKTVASRRPWLTQRTSSVRTTTVSDDDMDEENENVDKYDGDLKPFRNIRKCIKKIMKDIKKYFQNLNASEIVKLIMRLFSNRNDD